MKQKKVALFLTLLLTMLLLSGCGVSGGGVDVQTTDPDGLWQSIVVWPLANALIWLNGILEDAGIPYNWGFAIILFTIAIRVVTLPLTITQIRGMEAQKQLQPKLQELQKKYGKDRERMSQEQMKLYKEAGVNPLSGCLPLIVQMPILFGLYSALVALGYNWSIGEPPQFFWIPDLGFPAYTAGLSWISVDFNEGNYLHLARYLVLPIFLMASQYVMQKWMTAAPTTGDSSQAGMMKQMSTIMTFMFGFFTLQVPAGLSLYWVTSNLLQMLQQWLITSGNLNLTSSAKVASDSSDAGDAGDSDVIDLTAETVTTDNGSTSKKEANNTSNKKSNRRRSKNKRK